MAAPGATDASGYQVGAGENFISWIAPDFGESNVTGYFLERNVNSGGWGAFQSFGGSDTQYTDYTSYAVGDFVQYRVYARNADGDGPAGNVVSITVEGPPQMPSDVSATGGVSSVDVTWTAPTGSNDTRLWYGNNSGISSDQTGAFYVPVDGYTSHQFTALSPGAYYTVLSGQNSYGTAWSNEASFTITGPPPDFQSSLDAELSDNDAALSWTVVNPIQTLAVYWRNTSGIPADSSGANAQGLSSGDTSYALNNLSPGTWYVALYGTNDAGGSWSNEITFTVAGGGGGGEDETALQALLLLL